MSVYDLTAIQQEHSLKAICDIAIKPGDGNSLKISFKVYGKFAPLSLANVQAHLFIAVSRGEEIVLRGKLEFIQTGQAHGLWFHYKFQPEQAAGLAALEFTGLNQYSNAGSLSLTASGKSRRIRNRFFRFLAEEPN